MNKETNAVSKDTTNEAKVKRSRKSFEDAKAERIKAVEDKLERARKHVKELEAQLEKEKSRKPAVRKLSEKAQAKRLGEMIAASPASMDEKIKALKALGITDFEGLL